MLHSMTGFGRSEFTIDEIYSVTIEVKSLNGKQLDLNLRLSSLVKPYEVEIRNIANKLIIRGSAELAIIVKQNGLAKPMQINKNIAAQYYKDIVELSAELNISNENILSTLLTLPEVVNVEQEILPEDSFEQIAVQISRTIELLSKHRAKEGVILYNDLQHCIQSIENGLQAIEPYEPLRIQRIRQRIQSALEDANASASIDLNRLEQELIYYIEKIDFSEEKIRLAQHCAYFKEILSQQDEMSKGKKLGFVLQEVGREINTLGSKANDASIQKIIVGMKDYLEKAKEQVLNVL
jgi:uncharacterized protein (TIGR00255 family)